jgi:hypothetical protein
MRVSVYNNICVCLTIESINYHPNQGYFIIINYENFCIACADPYSMCYLMYIAEFMFMKDSVFI